MVGFPEVQFEAAEYDNWVEFFTAVIAVAKIRGGHPDQIAEAMYTQEVKAKLGDMPTPPWHLKDAGL